MKKLNRKGFTLIELLAVVVIMAVILVVTIPSVLTSMNNAKKNQLQNATDSVAEWFSKQYELDKYGLEGTEKAYNDFKPTTSDKTFDRTGGSVALVAAGISKPGDNLDLAASKIKINETNGKICVTLVAKSGGSFYVNETGYNNTKTSAGC